MYRVVDWRQVIQDSRTLKKMLCHEHHSTRVVAVQESLVIVLIHKCVVW